jgi:hypothetical protein
MIGQPRISDLATKRVGCSALTAYTSSHEMWFNSSIVPGLTTLAAPSAPRTCRRTPLMRNITRAQRRTWRSRAAASIHGNNTATISTPQNKCPAMHANTQIKRKRASISQSLSSVVFHQEILIRSLSWLNGHAGNTADGR